MKSALVARLMRICGVFAMLPSCCTVLAAATLSPDAELGVYRFYAQYDASRARVGVYKQDGEGLWTPKQVGNFTVQPRNKDKKDGCETLLLSHLQSFPLNVMTSVDYLNPGELDKQEQLIKLLSPEQVTFLELTEPVPLATVEADSKSYPEFKISYRPDEDRPNHVHIRQAGMWIVGGQALYPFGNETFSKHHPLSLNKGMPVHFHTAMGKEKEKVPADVHDPHLIIIAVSSMPWQKNADLDRKKYPLVWEIGRAAQTKPEQMTALFTAAASIIAEEVETTYQSRNEDAFIFCKALDEDRMRLFRLIGFEPLEGACPAPNNCVMVAPLAKLLKRFPIGKQSSRAKRIQNALNNKVDTSTALNLLRRIQSNFRAELDVIFKDRGYHQKSPIVVHDLSPNYGLLLRAMGEIYGGLSTDDAVQFSQKFQALRGDYGDNRHIPEAIPIDIFAQDLTAQKAVRITNLDPDLVDRDSEYMPSILVGIHKYLGYRYKELGILEPYKIAEKVGTRFVIQTLHWRTASEANKLGGKQLPAVPGQDGRTLYTFVFDMDQVKKLGRENPQRVKRAHVGIAQGFWFFRRIAADPFKF